MPRIGGNIWAFDQFEQGDALQEYRVLAITLTLGREENGEPTTCELPLADVYDDPTLALLSRAKRLTAAATSFDVPADTARATLDRAEDLKRQAAKLHRLGGARQPIPAPRPRTLDELVAELTAKAEAQLTTGEKT